MIKIKEKIYLVKKNTFDINLPLEWILPNCGKLVSFHQNIVSEYAKLMETINFSNLFWGNFVQNWNIKKRRSLKVGIWPQKGYYLTVKYFHICELYVEICGQHWKLPTSPFLGNPNSCWIFKLRYLQQDILTKIHVGVKTWPKNTLLDIKVKSF